MSRYEDKTIEKLLEELEIEGEFLDKELANITGKDKISPAGVVRSVTDEERNTKKRWICSILRDIYNHSDNDDVKKYTIEAAIQAKKMTRKLAEYKAKELKNE